MARRKLTLPGIQDLSKEQEDARALPKNGQHLVVGGPGTGKSVLALLRSRRHHHDKDDYVFLVYNHLLHRASRQLFGEKLESQQWQSWFMNAFNRMTGRVVPRFPAKQRGGWEETDWQGVLNSVAGLEQLPQGNRPYLIIDEGQDMPPEFYQALINLGFENFYVVADQNQQIVPGQNSTRQDIQNILAIEPNEVIELQHNYRNSHSVARLAQEFYTGNPASPPPMLPVPGRSTAKRSILYEYGENVSRPFENMVRKILKTSDVNPAKLIGIIAPDNEVRKRYLGMLKSVDLKFDGPRPKVSTYAHGESTELEFDEGGIMVINAKSCKGLEFDIVFLADIDSHKFWPEISDQKKRLFYVMVARAIDRVIMLKEAGRHCPVEPILPTDPEVLERT